MSRRFLAIVEPVVIVMVVSFVYVRQLSQVEFHVDESHWIGTSYMYESFIRGRFRSDSWKESHETVTNPPVPRYVIGLGRSLGGYRRGDINRIWQYGEDYDSNVRHGSMPSEGLLWWSRFPMAILTVLSIWMAFWVIKQFAGRVAGYFWILLAITNAFLLLHTRRAMAESPILFFVTVACVFTCLAACRLTSAGEGAGWKTWLYLGVVGTSIGLAGGSKLNGFVVLGVPLLCVGAALLKRGEPIRSRLVQFVSYGVFVTGLTCVAFLGSYPYLWPEPGGRTVHLFTNRVEEMRVQAAVFPDRRLDGWNQRLNVMPQRVLKDYASIRSSHAFYINGGLLVLGTCVILFAVRKWGQDSDAGSASLVFLSTALMASVPTAFTMVEWDRYYLFPVFFSSMTCAIALGWLARQAIALIRGTKA